MGFSNPGDRLGRCGSRAHHHICDDQDPAREEPREWSSANAHDVIGIEIAMTCMGILIIAGADFSGGMPAGFVTLAAFIGGCLSLAAAIGLLRRPARAYFTTPHLAGHAEAERNAGHSGLMPTSARISQSIGVPFAVTTRYAVV
jgi:hypothetical protein